RTRGDSLRQRRRLAAPESGGGQGAVGREGHRAHDFGGRCHQVVHRECGLDTGARGSDRHDREGQERRPGAVDGKPVQRLQPRREGVDRRRASPRSRRRVVTVAHGFRAGVYPRGERAVIRRSSSVLAFCLTIAFTASAGRASAETIAIVGGKVFPVSGPAIENGTVVIVDGTITAVGANLGVPPDARQIDARGKWITPGLIHSATALGIVEVDAVDDSDDTRAKGERGVAAAVRVWDSLNPDSTLWAPAREDGVTSAVVLPGGGFVGGQAALVETLEGPRSEMVRKAPAGMFVDLTDRGSAEVRWRG